MFDKEYSPFEHGKIVKKGDEYFLKIRNRYNDKMIPKISKNYEKYMEKHLEVLNENAHRIINVERTK
jgi:hypothetical protein